MRIRLTPTEVNYAGAEARIAWEDGHVEFESYGENNVDIEHHDIFRYALRGSRDRNFHIRSLAILRRDAKGAGYSKKSN